MNNAYRYSADMYELFSKDTKEPTEDTSSTGLMKPKGTAKQEAPTDSYDPMGFTSGLGSTLRTFFDEEQIKALDSVGLSAQDKRDQMLNEYYAELDMDSLARESANQVNRMQELYGIVDAQGSKGAGITKRLQEDNLELTTSPTPAAQPEAEEATAEIDESTLEAMAFDAMDTSNVEVDTPVVQEEEVATGESLSDAEESTTGAGLMSQPSDSEDSEVTNYESKLFETGRDQVEGVQGVLTQLGYVPRGVDGSVGSGTRSALRHFQRNNGLTVTGEVDDATIDKLKSSNKTGFTFSDATNGLYGNYVTDGIEGAGHHLGRADYQRVGITLEAGIVPDSGLKYNHNGTIIDLPENRSQRWATLSSAGVTRSNFNADNVITDDVVKSGVARRDYDSDETFTKAVLTAFQDKAEDKVVELGYSRGDFDADARKTLGDLAWNAGTDPIGYTSMRPVLVELAKPLADRDTTAMQGLLNTAPTSNGKILGGVMKRRAIQYNWSVPSANRVVRVESSAASGTGTYHFRDGTTKTITRTAGADTQDERVPEL